MPVSFEITEDALSTERTDDEISAAVSEDTIFLEVP